MMISVAFIRIMIIRYGNDERQLMNRPFTYMVFHGPFYKATKKFLLALEYAV